MSIDTFISPCCRTQLLHRYVNNALGNGHNKFLKCSKCNYNYKLIDGIFRFLQDEQYASSFGFQWNKFSKTQLDSHTGLPISRDRLYKVSNWEQNLVGEKILEAGSGAGRFTEILVKTGADIFSFDLSNAVEANNHNNATSNLTIFQASIYEVPLPYNYFDKVLCLGVLQHTPDPRGGFESLAKHVKVGGSLVIDIYANRLRSTISWKYLLRPFTKKMDKQRLFTIVSFSVDRLLPLVKLFKRLWGKLGARLFPITEYSQLPLSSVLNREWAILDTFDMYSPAHDHPKTISQVKMWFDEQGFVDVKVEYGPNGIIGRGKKSRISPIS